MLTTQPSITLRMLFLSKRPTLIPPNSIEKRSDLFNLSSKNKSWQFIFWTVTALSVVHVQPFPTKMKTQMLELWNSIGTFSNNSAGWAASVGRRNVNDHYELIAFHQMWPVMGQTRRAGYLKLLNLTPSRTASNKLLEELNGPGTIRVEVVTW